MEDQRSIDDDHIPDDGWLIYKSGTLEIKLLRGSNFHITDTHCGVDLVVDIAHIHNMRVAFECMEEWLKQHKII